MKTMSNYAIRNRRTGELVKTFDNPIEAELAIRNEGKSQSEYEVAERTSENVYMTAADGRTYIVGVKHLWISYEA